MKLKRAIAAIVLVSALEGSTGHASVLQLGQRLGMLRLNALLVPQGSASEARRAVERRRLAIMRTARHSLLTN